MSEAGTIASRLELSGEQAGLLRDLLDQRLRELATEINRTDSVE